MVPLILGALAFSFGSLTSSRLRARVRPQTPQARRINRLKSVNPAKQTKLVRTMGAINTQLDTTCGCR